MLQETVAVLGNLADAVTLTPVSAVGLATAEVQAPATPGGAVSEASVDPSAISTIQLLVDAFASIAQALREDFLV